MNRRKAFSLPELLVVIAIIIALISMMLPAIQKVRESANKTKCLNNMRQLGIAMHLYHDMHSAFPRHNPTIVTGLFPVLLLPYIEQSNQDLNNPGPISIFTCASRNREGLARFDFAFYPNITNMVPTEKTVLSGGWDDVNSPPTNEPPVTLRMACNTVGGGSFRLILLAHKSMSTLNYQGFNAEYDCAWNQTFSHLGVNTAGRRNYMRVMGPTGGILAKDSRTLDVTRIGFGSPHETGSPCLVTDGSVRVFNYRWVDPTAGGDAKRFAYMFSYGVQSHMYHPDF